MLPIPIMSTDTLVSCAGVGGDQHAKEQRRNYSFYHRAPGCTLRTGKPFGIWKVGRRFSQMSGPRGAWVNLLLQPVSDFRRASDTNQMTKATVSDTEVIWARDRFVRALKLDGISALASDVPRVPDGF
jgi:hypothetical protein